MITFTKEQLIASAHARIEFAEMMLAGELEPLKERTWSIELELARIALASLEAEKIAEPVAKVETVGVCWYADNGVPRKPAVGTELYSAPPAPLSVPDFGALTKSIVQRLVDYGAADDDAIASAEEFVYNACRAAMLQGADGKPELTVWYGAMPETNGKTNWTAMLHRKGHHPWEGITIDRSEYPGRVRYEADRMRHLIGELADEPDILAYDSDAHSGYVEPVTTAYKLPFDQWLSQQTGTIDVECGCVMTEVFFHWLRVAYEAGNSPVIPDGWVMVPVEPTEDMIVNGFESEPDESFSDEREWEAYDAMSGCQQAAHRAKLCWAAMIAAAPKPEVK